MEKYAVVRYGGRQLLVSPGVKFDIERQENAKMEVLAYFDKEKLEVGTPLLNDVEVVASIVEQKRAPKIQVKRFRNKSRYRKNKGHKQPISVILVTDIVKKGEKKAEKAEKIEKTEKATKVNAETQTATAVEAPAKKVTTSAKSTKTEKSVKAEKIAKKDVKVEKSSKPAPKKKETKEKK